MIRFVRIGVWILLVAPLAAGLTAGQSPAAPTPNTQASGSRAGTAVIVGQLVDAGSGAPIASAIVSLAPAGAPGPAGPPVAGARAATAGQPFRVMADADGRFVFHSLPAGAYSLTATRSGYASASLVQTRPTGSGRRLALTDGQRILNVRMTMSREPRISGTLFDESGEPAVGANLKLVIREGSNDARRYRVRSFAATDDRGQYSFGYLVPGDYLVVVQLMVPSVPLETAAAYLDAMAAGPSSANQVRTDVTASGGFLATGGVRIGDQLIQRSSNAAAQGGVMGPVLVRADGKTFVYPTTFYPGVPTIAAATVVTLKWGEERAGVNFAVKPVPAVRVTGTVTGPNGPMPNTTVMIVPAGLEGSVGTPSFGGEVAQAITRGNGTFSAPAVPAGDHVASVVRMPGATDLVLWGRTPVHVGDASVDGVAIHLAPGATVSGRVEFEAGLAAAPTGALLQRARIVMGPVEGGSAIRPSAASIEADGSFRTRGYPPGQYTLGVGQPPPGWVVKSLMAGGRDLLDGPLDLAGSDVNGAVVTLTDKAGEISGVVTSTAADAGALVVLVPIDARGQVNVRRMRNVVVGDDGTYRVASVLPGEHFVIAVPGTTDLQDTSAMAAWARRGTRVTIGDREKRTLPLQVIQVRQP